MDEVTCSRLDLTGDNFLSKSSRQPCRVLPSLVLACLALGPLLQESLFEVEVSNVEPFQFYSLIVVFGHLLLVLDHSLGGLVSYFVQTIQVLL